MIYVGIDVASEKHDCAILDSESGELCDTFILFLFKNIDKKTAEKPRFLWLAGVFLSIHLTRNSITFPNNRLGFETLISKLTRFSKSEELSDIEIGLESTGHYSNNLVNFLHEKRLCVKVFNPLSVQRLRKAQTLRRTKTDKTDAKFLACMLFQDDSKPFEKSITQISELKTLTRHRLRLVKETSKHKQHISYCFFLKHR